MSDSRWQCGGEGKYMVTTGGGKVLVEADCVMLSEQGTLVFSHAGVGIVKAYAPGAWRSFERERKK